MSISWSVPGLSVLRTDGGASPSAPGAGKSSQNADSQFANLMEVRGSMNTQARGSVNSLELAQQKIAQQSISPSQAKLAAQAAQASQISQPNADMPTDRLQHRALSALNTLTGGTLDRAKNSLQGMQGILLNGGSLQRARGIALDTNSRGIELDPAQRRTLQQRRDALAQAGQAERTAGTREVSRNRRAAATAEDGLGKLAARFESGSEGISAIGYDRVGGTSYGKYQIASRPGSMNQFMEFLKTNDPSLAERLAAAGPANTGSTKGQMPDVWREIAAESPEYFEKLQEKFIRESHYEPARQALEGYGYKTKDFSSAMREVLFSTSVQHGPAGAARIFSQAADTVGLRPSAQREQEREIIQQVYTLRADRFGSSTPQIQAAAKKRMEEEGRLALAMN